MLPPLSILGLEKVSFLEPQADIQVLTALVNQSHLEKWKMHMAAMLIATYLYTEGVKKIDIGNKEDEAAAQAALKEAVHSRSMRQLSLTSWLLQLGFKMNKDWITVYDYIEPGKNVALIQVAKVTLETRAGDVHLLIFTGTRDPKLLYISQHAAILQTSRLYVQHLNEQAHVYRRTFGKEFVKAFDTPQYVKDHIFALFGTHGFNIVAGHSLGGGLAVAFVDSLQQKMGTTWDEMGHPRPSVVTFGSPIMSTNLMDFHYVTRVPPTSLNIKNIVRGDPASMFNKNTSDTMVFLQHERFNQMGPTEIHLCYAYLLGLAYLFLNSRESIQLDLPENEVKFLENIVSMLLREDAPKTCGHLFSTHTEVLGTDGKPLHPLLPTSDAQRSTSSIPAPPP